MSLGKIPLCQLCQVTFDSVEDLSLHSCTDIKQEIKDYELQSNFKLNEDVEKPTLNKKPKRKLVMCRICNKTFEGNYKLKRHEKIHIKNGEIIPSDKVFESKTKIETLEPITKIEMQETQDFKVEEHYDLDRDSNE